MSPSDAEAASALVSTLVERCRLLPDQVADVVRYLERKRARVEDTTHMQCVYILLTYLMPGIWHEPEAAAEAICAKMSGLTDNTRRVRIGEIRRFVAWLRDKGRIPLEVGSNAIELLHGPRVQMPLPTTLSYDDAESRIQRALHRPAYSLPGTQTVILLLLHLHCGLRRNEGLFLTWGEVDIESRRVCLSRTPVRRLKSERACRAIPMSGVLLDLMGHWHRSLKPSPDARLFEPTFHPFVNSRRWYGNTGLMRHTFASALAGHGLDAWRLARYMGHSSPETTARYYIGRFVRIPYFDPSLFMVR